MSEHAVRAQGRAVPRGRARPTSRVRVIAEAVLVVFLAVSVALIARANYVAAFYIPSESMVPTLRVGDRLLVNRVSYRLHDVDRGDIVVFHRPPRAADPNIKDLVKRVIGLPGETIEARGGEVYVNGVELSEGYLPEGTVTDNLPLTRIPPDSYFMMGDNRSNSSDSRFFGPVPHRLLVGKAFVRILPITKLGRLRAGAEPRPAAGSRR